MSRSRVCMCQPAGCTAYDDPDTFYHYLMKSLIGGKNNVEYL